MLRGHKQENDATVRSLIVCISFSHSILGINNFVWKIQHLQRVLFVDKSVAGKKLISQTAILSWGKTAILSWGKR